MRESADQERFLALLAANRRPLLKVCWAYGYTTHDRDDLFQEIASRLWASFDKYDPARNFSTWMYRVALNVAIDFRRRQRRRAREVAVWDDGGVEIQDAARDDATQTQLDELRELLERQSEADRALLILCLEGYSHREIGEVLGISESNVGTRLNRLKKSLRQTADTKTDSMGDRKRCNSTT